jgi:cytochrome c556
MREILTEILRSDDFKGRPADFKSWMEAARSSAGDLEARLRQGAGAESIRLAHEALGRSCSDCHKPYRNAPRK